MTDQLTAEAILPQEFPSLGPVALEGLHPALLDAKMDSMRVLSETAMAFPDALSFSSGAPYDGDYDLNQISRQIEQYFACSREAGVPEALLARRMFHYGPVNGFILAEIAQMLRVQEGIEVPEASIMVTNGFQEALLIALRGLFSSPDEVLLTVAPAYVGILGAARMLDIPYRGVLEGPEGICAENVLEAIRATRAEGKRPRALYLIPDFSNPSGTVIPLDTRRRLLEIAEAEDLLILEDNPYGIFAPDGEQLPTFKALDTRQRVVFLGSFAKSAFPGARMGYLIADQILEYRGQSPRYLAQRLSLAKSMFSVGTSSLSQALIAGLLHERGYDLRKASESSRDVYLERLKAALENLALHFPPSKWDQHGVGWNEPRGGFFIVLNLPFTVDLALMEHSAREYGVSWAPMNMFYPEGGGERQLRLGVSNLEPAKIAEGIARLARFITDHAARTGQGGKS